jgi:hypothetical protein
MTVQIQRRQLLWLAAGAGLSACAPLQRGSPFWRTLAAGVRRPEGPAITRDYAEKLPYASMLGWFDKASKALLVLGEYGADDRLTWYSAERQSITTQGPFIIQALGTEIELRSSRSAAGWDKDPRAMVGRKIERTLEFLARGDRVEVVTESLFRPSETRMVNILGANHNLREFVESVSAAGRRRYENSYWIDEATGRCWKSRQVLAPTLPHFNIEIVKYPQRG